MFRQVILGLIVAVLIYVTSQYLLPEPAKRVGYFVSAAIAIVFLLNFLLAILGIGAFLPATAL